MATTSPAFAHAGDAGLFQGQARWSRGSASAGRIRRNGFASAARLTWLGWYGLFVRGRHYRLFICCFPSTCIKYMLGLYAEIALWISRVFIQKTCRNYFANVKKLSLLQGHQLAWVAYAVSNGRIHRFPCQLGSVWTGWYSLESLLVARCSQHQPEYTANRSAITRRNAMASSSVSPIVVTAMDAWDLATSS